MNEIYAKLQNCYESIWEKIDFKPRVALVLGSGLGSFGSEIEVCEVLDYSEIKGFPVSTVEGHQGRYIFGYIGNVPVVCMQGRVHYYEGYSMPDVVLPVRLMGRMGAEALILTNAAGGIQQGMQAGDLMLITGQIASFVPSPLIGENMKEFGVRFPDMSQIYEKEYQKIIQKTALDLEIDLKQGVYLQTSGPQYESPEEISMFRTLGADAVGMSTACEAIAAKHMGMKIAGISCISNLASGITKAALSHEEVKQTAKRAEQKFQKLIYASVEKIGKHDMKPGGTAGE